MPRLGHIENIYFNFKLSIDLVRILYSEKEEL